MREADATTRQRLADALRTEPATPSELAVQLDLTPYAVLQHAEHVSQSVSSDETAGQFLVAPPTCQECNFDAFDDLLNLPSRCPDCKSESVSEPTLTIDEL